jgi:hypothetical protein
MTFWNMIIFTNRVPMIHVGCAIVDMTLTKFATVIQMLAIATLALVMVVRLKVRGVTFLKCAMILASMRGNLQLQAKAIDIK